MEQAASTSGWNMFVRSFFTQDRNENWKDIIKMMARGGRLPLSLAELMVGVLLRCESRSLSYPTFCSPFLSLSFSGKELQRRNKE